MSAAAFRNLPVERRKKFLTYRVIALLKVRFIIDVYNKALFVTC